MRIVHCFFFNSLRLGAAWAARAARPLERHCGSGGTGGWLPWDHWAGYLGIQGRIPSGSGLQLPKCGPLDELNNFSRADQTLLAHEVRRFDC